MGQFTNQQLLICRADFGFRDEFEGKGNHDITSENRHGFAGMDMQGWPATAHVVIIHGRQVVMNQAEAVDQFHCRSRWQGRGSLAANGLTAKERQGRPQAFSSPQDRVSDSFQQVFRQRGASQSGFKVAIDLRDRLPHKV